MDDEYADIYYVDARNAREHRTQGASPAPGTRAVTVPPSQYFMMGDNRDNSQDSRYWGFLPAHYVKGRALFIYFSFEEGGSLTQMLQGTRFERLFDSVK